MSAKVLVLGGGIGGVVASTLLKRTLGSDVDVTLVDRNEYHRYAASFPFLIIGKRTPQSVCRPLAGLEQKEVKFLRAEVTGLDLPKRQVATNRGRLSYDYLIIALGVDYHPETVPGFGEFAYNVYDFHDVVRLSERIPHFNEGRIVLFISSLPYKCPIAPYEITLLLDEYFRRHKNRSRVHLTLVSPESRPEPLAGPLVSHSISRMLTQRGIQLYMQAKILAMEQKTLVLDNGIKVPGDLFLGIASHWCPDVLRTTDLASKNGWVKVNPSTLETEYSGVFAVGDCTDIRVPVSDVPATKAGIFAHYQAEVVARNIARLVRGQKPTFRYKGKGT